MKDLIRYPFYYHIYNLDEGEIIDFLLKQEENGTSYELLEDIRARITELSGNRAKIIISALFKSMKSLNKTVRKSWLSMSTGVYAEHMVFDATDTRAELGSSRTDSLPSTSDNTPTLLKISISAPAPARDSLASLSPEE